MQIEDCVAIVTGANRGIGRAFAEALLEAGARKVYAGARDPASVDNPRLTPISLDVTNPSDVPAAAAACDDATLLINNAGICAWSPILGDKADRALRAELEVNVFGLLAMTHAFAPILARNGGGTIANMLSVVSWFVGPFNATYSASKYAALAVTNATRIQLKEQGTQVIGIYAGFVDTDMAAHSQQPKTSPHQVAQKTLEGIVAGADDVYAHARSEEVWETLKTDPAAIYAPLQRRWDER